MKRILLIAILISYSVVSLGVSVNYFYCCGKLKEVSIEIKAKTKEERGCCDTKKVDIQLNTDQKNTDTGDYTFTAPVFPAITYTINYNFSHSYLNEKRWLLCKRSLAFNALSKNILFCVFRI